MSGGGVGGGGGARARGGEPQLLPFWVPKKFIKRGKR